MIATILLAAMAATGRAGDGWETVISQNGQFVVEMPAKPNFERSRTRTRGGARTSVTMIGCDTPGGAFLAMKIEFPTGILKGGEEAHLDEERDGLAAEYNGKVVTEKKVKLDGGAPGRDFTIRGKRDDGPGVVMIRVREHVSGKAIYALLVASAPNRELPDEAGRFLGSLTIGTKPDLARANRKAEELAPVGKELKGWGEAVDPDGDCQFKPEGDVLTIEVPAALHDLNADIAKWNAPRVLREIEGDFVATVKVVGKFQPGAKSLNPKSIPCNGGGLFIWSDGDNYIRLERMAGMRKGKVNTFSIFEEREGGHRGAMHNGGLPEGTAFLRLARTGSRIVGATSLDGKKWDLLKPIDVTWPGKLKVGLDAINSGSDPFTVRFEEFSINNIKGGSAPTAPPDPKAKPRGKPNRDLSANTEGGPRPAS